MEDPIQIIEEGLRKNLFTDYDLAVEGPEPISSFGGAHTRSDVRPLHDLASLTKIYPGLVWLKDFEEGRANPFDPMRNFLPIRELKGDKRSVAHFLCGGVQGYGWKYDPSNDSEFAQDVGNFKEALLSRGFGLHLRKFQYENVASIYAGMGLEAVHGKDLEKVLHRKLPFNGNAGRFLFHPVRRGLVSPHDVIPTQENPTLRGYVHDPLSYQHQGENLSVAGIFSDAETVAHVTHETLTGFSRAFYSLINRKWLRILRLDHRPDEDWGLGWDKPGPNRFQEVEVKDSLIFTGFTGGRLLHGYVRGKPFTIALLTNHVLCRTKENNPEYRALWWRLANAVANMQS